MFIFSVFASRAEVTKLLLGVPDSINILGSCAKRQNQNTESHYADTNMTREELNFHKFYIDDIQNIIIKIEHGFV